MLLGPTSPWALATPREDARRGGHVALEHPDATRIYDALVRRGIHPGFKTPDTFRLAPSPLYTTYAELWQAVEALRQLGAVHT